MRIAEKRFLIMKQSGGANFELLKMFGDKENLDAECREVCKNRTTHLQYILREDSNIAKNDEICLVENVKGLTGAEKLSFFKWGIRGRIS